MDRKLSALLSLYSTATGVMPSFLVLLNPGPLFLSLSLLYQLSTKDLPVEFVWEYQNVGSVSKASGREPLGHTHHLTLTGTVW